MKHKETYGEMAEMGKTCREMPLGEFLNHLDTSFPVASYVAGFICE